LAAVVQDGGQIYASTNLDGNWILLPNSPSQNWQSIASSADGSKLIASSVNYLPFWLGGIYTSSDSGATWIQSTNLPGTNWIAVASSANGIKLVAAVDDGSIYVSTNAGATWTATSAPAEDWRSLASSSDGTKLIAASNGPIYTSNDSGTTWISNNVPGGYWRAVASSADGNILEAVVPGGGIWTMQNTPSPQLNLTVSNTGLAFSWTVPSANFLLQQNLDLTTTNWVTLTNTPALNLTNLNNELTLSPSNSSGFFRLISQ
jgi:hypothetical protein